MVRNILNLLLALIAVYCQAQIGGPSNPVIATTKTYTYDIGYLYIGGIDWEVTSGTIHSTSGPNDTEYSSEISFNSGGTQTITAKHGYNGNVLATYQVNVFDVGVIGGEQTICNGQDPTKLTNVQAAGSGSYQWQSKCDLSECQWQDITGANNATFNPDELFITTKYRRGITISGTTKYSNVETITVFEPLSSGQIGNEQTVCYNENPTALTNELSVDGGDGDYDYQWQFKNSSGEWTNLSGEENATYNPPALTSTMTYRRRVKSCDETKWSNEIVITVLPALSPGTIGNDQVVCSTTDPAGLQSLTDASGGDGDFNYKWQEKTIGGSWTNITGANSKTFDPDELSETMKFRRRVISCGQTEYSNVITIDVDIALEVGSIGNDQVICYNEDAAQITVNEPASGGDGDYTYLWEEKEIGGTWIPILNSLATYDPPQLTKTKLYRRKTISCDQSDYSNTITIQVGDELVAGDISSSQIVSYNTIPETLSSTNTDSGGDGSYSYQWQIKCALTICEWVDIEGATSEVFTPDEITSQSRFRRKVTSCNQEAYSNEVIITPLQGYGFAGYISGPSQVTGSSSGDLEIIGESGVFTWYSSIDNGDTWTELNSTSANHSFNNLQQDTYFKVEVNSNGDVRYSDPFLVVVKNNNQLDIVEQNFNKSTTLLTQEDDLGEIGSISDDLKLDNYSYMDGMGRTVQSVSKGATSAGNDLISFRSFDHTLLSDTTYLPYVSSGNDYYVDPATAQKTFYSDMMAEPTPYAVRKLDASPRKLLLEQGAPGEDWQLGNGHTIKYSYRFNTDTDAVPRYDASDLTALDEYAAKTLNVTEVTDENGHKVRTYTDSRGLTVMKQVEQSSGVYASTVNVYDLLGKLRFVLPPNATKYIEDNPSSLSLTVLRDQEDLIFEYRYDDKGRLIERKVPGKGWEYIVYDPFDRVALTQDAIMRTQNQWAFAKKDRIGRTLYSGLYTDSSSRSQLQIAYDALDYDGGNEPYYEHRGTTLHGYTNTVFPSTNLEVHSVNYYDDYDFDRDGNADYAFDDTHYSGQETETIAQTRLLPTGSKTRILGSNDWLVGVNFYNEDGRVIQSLSNNHKRLTVDNKTTYVYADFTGELLKSRTEITTDSETTNIRKKYSYDHLKRLETVEHKLNGEDWVVLNDLTYNELGQLIEKNLHSPLEGGAGGCSSPIHRLHL